MPDESLAILSDDAMLAISTLTEALDGITADIVDARTYGGPDAHRHAQSQARRELAALLIDLARAKRKEPA